MSKPRYSQLFNRTRWQLAGWYTLGMGILLGIAGVGLDQAILQTQRYVLRQKLASLAGTIHDSLEPVLSQPGQLDPRAHDIVPGLCSLPSACHTPNINSNRHIVGVFRQEGFYLRLLDFSGQEIAFVGQRPLKRQRVDPRHYWYLISASGERFYQISLLLRTQIAEPWGYLQIGRSLKEWDDYLGILRLSLLASLPLVVLGVGAISWVLAGIAMQPIHRSYQQMQQFTSDAAHELRTPLTVLQSALEEIRLAATLSESQQNLDILERQSARLLELVTGLLTIARLEQSEISIPKEPCSLNLLLADLAEEFTNLAQQSQVTLELEVGLNSLEVWGNVTQIYRLFSNLISNGIRYTPPGGSVWIRLAAIGKKAVVEIEDTGIGIPATDINRIFDRFYRVQQDRSRSTGGAGLGLSIALEIARFHQGTIEAKSQPDRGTLFTVALPLIGRKVAVL